MEFASLGKLLDQRAQIEDDEDLRNPLNELLPSCSGSFSVERATAGRLMNSALVHPWAGQWVRMRIPIAQIK